MHRDVCFEVKESDRVVADLGQKKEGSVLSNPFADKKEEFSRFFNFNETDRIFLYLLSEGWIDEAGKLNPKMIKGKVLPSLSKEELERIEGLCKTPLSIIGTCKNPKTLEKRRVNYGLKKSPLWFLKAPERHLSTQTDPVHARKYLKGSSVTSQLNIPYFLKCFKVLGIDIKAFISGFKFFRGPFQ